MSPAASYDIDVVVTRGAAAESIHRVSAAVVVDDRLVAYARDPEHRAYWRSCAKPFQLIPFMEAGGADELGWGPDQIALACASHGGEPEHVAIAELMLGDLGLEPGQLGEELAGLARRHRPQWCVGDLTDLVTHRGNGAGHRVGTGSGHRCHGTYSSTDHRQSEAKNRVIHRPDEEFLEEFS